jgi:nucleotide-binding universal stress UspA family protein
MSYKTLVVHADTGPAADARFRVAAALALRFDAHLIACAPTGISRFIEPDVIVREGTALAQVCAAMRAGAADALRRCAQVVSEHGLPPAEERIIDDDAGGIAAHARYADLVVLSQPDVAMPMPGSASDLPGCLLRESGRPLLLMPRAGSVADLHGTVVLAWDGSLEATRAMIGALPLLRAAASVSVVHLDDGTQGPRRDACLRSEMTHYLRRQGVQARASYRAGRLEAGEALLSTACDAGAGLLVMGGYGRSPLRESVFGGVTAAVLRSMTLPVLLAH